MGTITSADAVLTLGAQDAFTNPVQIEGFAVDDAFETAEVENAEVMKGVDGKLSVGWIPVLNRMTITLQADSVSMFFFDTVNQTENQARRKLRLDGSLSIPSTGQLFTLVNGYSTKYTPTPKAGKVLQARKFEITFDTISVANQ